ncbi:hypothetical protein HHK36_032721 [Tetracentron sinense]|uniref:DYW domain-containing protein n=1 Tax=Tetracentron sinense TaxID=13715 RepID=A0A835D061_TETSI|nr:hypothetical protein HHK36_032721 [Tetracentron sinense]
MAMNSKEKPSAAKCGTDNANLLLASWNTIIDRFDLARQFFDRMPESDLNGYIDEAREIFNKNSISWDGILAQYVQKGRIESARLVGLLSRNLFGRMLGRDEVLWNTMISGYSQNGELLEAQKMFEESPIQDVFTSTTMVFGYVRNGMLNEARKNYDEMLEKNSVLWNAMMAGHTDLVDKGTEYFYSMDREYGLTGTAQHYTCMIDLLGHTGRLEDPQVLMSNMPVEPDATSWSALLGASRNHGGTKLVEEAAERIFEMGPDNSGMYVFLLDLSAASSRWSGVAGDSVNPEKDIVYAFLEELDLQMKREGYVSSKNMVLHDMEEEEEHMLKFHSEKLAVAFGILTVPSGRPVRVIKNLRVCEDCHNAIRYVSKILGRLRILWDSNRYHHFDGRFMFLWGLLVTPRRKRPRWTLLFTASGSVEDKIESSMFL